MITVRHFLNFVQLIAAIRFVESEYVHAGKVAIKYRANWEILYVKDWSEEFGELVCTRLGFPRLLKNFRRLEIYRHQNDYDNFRCQNRNNKLVCCPTKPEERSHHPSISEVALACEQGKINEKHTVYAGHIFATSHCAH